MKPEIGMQVIAHTGSTSMGHSFIYETFRAGKIIRVNEHSIRVKLENERRATNGTTQSDKAICTIATFAFWKIHPDNGKALYKHTEYGIITL